MNPATSIPGAVASDSANAPHAMPDVAAMRMPVPVPHVTPSRDEVVKALAARRAHNLASFRAYRKGGVYPHNFIRRGPLNVWRDRDGHLCAAATMIDKDGKHDLVNEIARDNNGLRLLDVTEGPMMDWILTSGFTLEEIDRIQAPMVYPDVPEFRDTTAEDARLSKLYARTDAWLVKHAKTGLDQAAKRLLLDNPDLAARLVEGTI
ncbi:MAG TPA: hypothetical protein VLB44_25340 [Kofleriaceae bacterium]|nr:hypothetical protein [Kofleriaceae bacterium]